MYAMPPAIRPIDIASRIRGIQGSRNSAEYETVRIGSGMAAGWWQTAAAPRGPTLRRALGCDRRPAHQQPQESRHAIADAAAHADPAASADNDAEAHGSGGTQGPRDAEAAATGSDRR